VATRYYQLVSALPPVPYFRRAGRLPMSRRRLEHRLGMLETSDRRDLRSSEALIRWSQQPVNRTTAELASMYRKVVNGLESRSLKSVMTNRMNMRTVLVALRLRRRKSGPPEHLWGLGPYVRTIESRWAEPGFGLEAVFPWIGAAAGFLERGDAMELEGLLMDESWKMLSRVAERAPFGFEDVFAFVFKLDILTRWLSYDAEAASRRFEQLIMEVTSDHQQLFT